MTKFLVMTQLGDEAPKVWDVFDNRADAVNEARRLTKLDHWSAHRISVAKQTTTDVEAIL